jgi:molecular chaperone GrpE
MPESFHSPTTDDGASTSEGAVEMAAESDELAMAIAERDDLRDKLLRAHAELENYRKRVQREREEDRRYAAGPLARDLLPVFDNLQRAIAAAGKGGSVEDLRQGVEMVVQQAREVLAKHDIQAIAAAGEPLDPNRHEAITQIPSAEHPPLTVLQEVETGFMLHDRVLRPTKVIVASAPPVEPPS